MARIARPMGWMKRPFNGLRKPGTRSCWSTCRRRSSRWGTGSFDAIIIRSATKLPAEVLEAPGDRLKVIGRAGVVSTTSTGAPVRAASAL